MPDVHAEPNSAMSVSGTAKVGNIVLWIFQILLALVFEAAGSAKLVGVEAMVKEFEAIGFGQWFRYVTGVLEIVAAIALVVPRTCGLGALFVVAIMAGAVGAHLVLLKTSPVVPLVLLVIAAVIAWGRRGRTRRLFLSKKHV